MWVERFPMQTSCLPASRVLAMMRNEKDVKAKRALLRGMARVADENEERNSAQIMRLKADALDWVLCSVGQI